MEFRFQYFFLIISLVTMSYASQSLAAGGEKLDLNNEYFEFGVSAGILSVQDFGAEPTVALSATFIATEDFFLQYNYQFSDISLSTYEDSDAGIPIAEGDDRFFRRYDFLLGYNVFQSEFFVTDGYTTIGNLYTVIGVGNNSFAGEDAFSTTVGVGFKVGLNRRWNLRADFRDYIHKAPSILANDDRTHNTSFTVGLSFLW